MKGYFCTALGTIGSGIALLFGGWDTALITLLIFMAIDYISGLIVAGVFKKSKKSETGGIQSHASFKGLIKKCMILAFVVIGCRLDLMMGASYIRDAVCITFIVNETISIIENAGLMGVPFPKVITNALDILNNKAEKK